VSQKSDRLSFRRESDEKLISVFARLAIVFAGLLTVGEVIRNWGDWQWWPFWLVDYLAAGLLFFGGRLALKAPQERRVGPLVGALGFTASLAYMSFFGHLSSLNEGTNGPIPHTALTAIIGVLFVAAFVSFSWLLRIASRAEQ
jgi:hypothetical protein